MRVFSQQPNLLPWVGFWNKMMLCEKMIVIAGCDYAHQDYQNRVKVEGSWLTIPVAEKFKPIFRTYYKSDQDIRDAADRLEKTFCVKRYKYAYRMSPVLESIRCSGRSLFLVNMAVVQSIAKTLQCGCDFEVDLNRPNPKADKTENFVDQVMTRTPWGQSVEYMAGGGTLSFLDRARVPFTLLRSTLKENYSTDSICRALVELEYVQDYVREAITWTPV